MRPAFRFGLNAVVSWLLKPEIRLRLRPRLKTELKPVLKPRLNRELRPILKPDLKSGLRPEFTPGVTLGFPVRLRQYADFTEPMPRKQNVRMRLNSLVRGVAPSRSRVSILMNYSHLRCDTSRPGLSPEFAWTGG